MPRPMAVPTRTARFVLRTPQGPQASRPSARPDRTIAAAAVARYRRRQRRPISPSCSTGRSMRSGSRSDSAAANIWSPKRWPFPILGFIGCEPYVNGMAKILAQIEAHNIGNIRLFAGDAAELLAWAPPHSLARIDLIHPDPWPKRRHWKRRFVQDATVAAMARILKPSRRISLCQRYRRLLRLDTGASVALARFRVDRASAPTTGACPGRTTR